MVKSFLIVAALPLLIGCGAGANAAHDVSARWTHEDDAVLEGYHESDLRSAGAQETAGGTESISDEE